MKQIITLTLSLLISIMAFANAPKTKVHWPNTNTINENWLYLEKDTEDLPREKDGAYTQINLPHTWNASDVLETKDYRRAASWYRKNITFDAEHLQKRNYIRFGAAGQQCKVYLNGELLTHHFGGYGAFTCELVNLKEGKNVIDVWVSNANSQVIAPTSADFNFYGGLYRSVQLIEGPQISISRKELGGPGFRVWSEKVSQTSSDLKVRVKLDNASQKKSKLSLKMLLQDANGNIVSELQQKISVEANSEITPQFEMPTIINPNLWSPENPNLYQLKISLLKGKTVVDEVECNYGFRWFEFTADKGFFLNGKSYKLNGINRHQDYYKKGNAVPLQLHYDDLMLMKEAGINWLRLAHYQQDDYMLQLCDELGMLVWEEIPLVNGFKNNDGFKNTLKSMMTDMIYQHYNHSSIILWGMGNEVWMKDRGDGKAQVYDIVYMLNEIAHKEDPVRKTVMVNGDNDRSCDYLVNQIPDVFGYNLYRGWYKTNYNDLTNRCLDLKKKNPGIPLIISEFGAGSDMNIHTDHPVRQDFSIEYQNDFLEAHLDQFAKMDWLCGVNRWSFADFGAAHRGDSKPHVNQKGLVTFDRQKKDAYYLLQSKWSDTPVVYIASASWKVRGGKAEKQYRVFTNLQSVEFFLNGKSLGSQRKGFTWNVNLKEGNNTLLAKGIKNGKSYEHTCNVVYDVSQSAYGISASKELPGHAAASVLDNDTATYWAADEQASLLLDLKRISLVNGISITFLDPDVYLNNIEISGSLNGEDWTVLYTGKINQWSLKETFMYPKQQEQRYIKVKSLANKKDKFDMGIREIEPLISFEKAEKNLYERVGAGE
ncbi:glycoside hydrolase family 2 protein [Saccharicrinis aurantiacus]|uniref:glycoside hydrolase family 2 protein n=1 Tax=Saccharicrinis aurantiacus TaxID=1849719 RepID=UPI0024921BAE|nr:glycoside hydrolase family 2 TIM barrel-domain containing protein [Saccharicrinis aurantiacus]